MTLKIGEPASPTFAQPLALLSDCHRRVERFLKVLQTLAKLPGGHELQPLEREALTVALRYFREAAPKHTADEEESLFPRLRGTAHPLAAKVLRRLQELEADHTAAAPQHELAETLGQRWLRDGSLSDADQELFRLVTDALGALYAQHIALEDNEVFPLAARVLSGQELGQVGSEMARRRGQNFVSPAAG